MERIIQKKWEDNAVHKEYFIKFKDGTVLVACYVGDEEEEIFSNTTWQSKVNEMKEVMRTKKLTTICTDKMKKM